MYRDGLYINNYKVDVENKDQLYLFNYESLSIESPDAIKNSYSLTVQLPCTSNNVKIFSHVERNDHTLHSANNNFNYTLRNKFELYDNGNLIEAGYVKLNKIDRTYSSFIYDITLFGMLGDFFYSLMYDDKGNELNLTDIIYDLYRIQSNITLGIATLSGSGWVPAQDVNTLIEHVDDEDFNNVLFNYNKNFIWNSWLMQFTDKYSNVDHPVWEQFITAAPVLNGYHNDFDNDHVLVNMNYPSDYENVLPSSITDAETTFTTQHGYSLITSQREMSEWEIRDLRSQYQRPAIRLAWLMKFISEYSKKNGYTISWDPDIDLDHDLFTTEKNTNLNEYFWRSYIVLNQIELNENRVNEVELPQIQTIWNSIDSPSEIYVIGQDETNVIDLSGYDNGAITIRITDEIRPFNYTNPSMPSPYAIFIDQNQTNNGTSSFSSSDYWPKRNSVLGTFVYKIDVMIDDVIDDSLSQLYFIYNNNGADVTFQPLSNRIRMACENVAESDFNWTKPIIIRNMRTENVSYPSEIHHWMRMVDPVELTILNIPSSDNIKIKITKDFYTFTWWKDDSIIIDGSEYRSVFTVNDIVPFRHAIGTKLMLCNLDSDHTMRDWREDYMFSFYQNAATDFIDRTYVEALIYEGSSSGSKNYSVTKKDLFGNTPSPFKCLIDWCKLFNMRIRPDIATRTIHIESHNHYYINEVIDLSSSIDYSSAHEITVIPHEYSQYKFTISDKSDDNYARYIYLKNNNNEYGETIVNIHNPFTNEHNDVFNDNIYRTQIDYLMSSPYFNTTETLNNIQYPPFTLPPKYESTLWHINSEGVYETTTRTLYGLQSLQHVNTLDDIETRPCMFDKDFKTIDSNFNIVLYDGLYTIPQTNDPDHRLVPYLLTDDLDIMYTLNDEQPCFLNARYDGIYITPYTPNTAWVLRELQGVMNINDVVGTIGLWTFMIPIMHASARTGDSYEYTMTYYYDKPEQYFGKTDWQTPSTMWNKFWNTYENDVLDIDSRICECECVLKDTPYLAMRKFYYFEDSLWILIGIKEYDRRSAIHNVPVRCKFLKVQNIMNYTISNNSTPEPTPTPTTQYDLYKCKWIINAYGSDPFTRQNIEDMLDEYYPEWQTYADNIALVNDLCDHIEPNYVTETHTIEQPMFNAMNTIGVDLDAYDMWMFEPYGEIIIIQGMTENI